ncbi:MAG: acetate/propionate family kinase [Xanthobacteraceae bacterium]
MDTILIVNAGSSSVKFQAFAVEPGARPACQIKGQMDGIGGRPKLRASTANGTVLVERTYHAETVRDVATALATAGAWLRDEHRIDPVAIGHRVVHGGPDYHRPVLVDQEVLARLERYVPLAPLHQPHNLAPIRSMLARFPELPQVACFDTAFHRGHGALADCYAIPHRLHAEGIRRYGFHGLSYEYVADRLRQFAPEIAAGRVIVAHLGSGASMCALLSGRSIESTLGFTALDGLPMGTRPGQLDPGVVLHLIADKGMTAAAVQDLLYHDCGLKGLSDISNDMRVLESSDDPRAAFAIDYFVYRIGLHAGMLAAALGGIDAFVFTAGIGENSALVRARVTAQLAWLGAVLDPAANAAHAPMISAPQSRVPVYVVPTNEEGMIARHTLTLLSGHALRQRTCETVL